MEILVAGKDDLKNTRLFFPSNGSSDVKCKKNGNVVYSGRALSYLANSQAHHSNMEITIAVVSPLARILYNVTLMRTRAVSASQIQK